MSKRLKIILGIVTGLLVVFIIVWTSPLGRFVLTGGLGDLDEKPFSKEEWMAAKDGELIVLRKRLLMADDLMNNHLKKGLDSAAVKDMLGEPEGQYGFSYAIGTLTVGMDPLFLVVDFDRAGKASRFDIKSEKTLTTGEDDEAIQINVNK